MKRTPIWLGPWRQAIPAFAAVACTQIATPAVSAERFDQTARTSGSSAPIQRLDLHSGSIEAVFRNRWSGDDNEYIVSGSGRIQVAAPSADAKREDHDSGMDQSHSDIDPFKEIGPCKPSKLTPSQIASQVYAASQRYGVDPDFALAVATTGNRQDHDRDAASGWHGPSQRTTPAATPPTTTKTSDLAGDIDTDVRLLRSLFETYRNPLIVAAAFYAGEANVRKFHGIPPFPETVRFVADVIDRQSGLPTVAVGDGKAGTGAEPSSADSNDTTGLLATGNAHRWVGGVMQF